MSPKKELLRSLRVITTNYGLLRLRANTAGQAQRLSARCQDLSFLSKRLLGGSWVVISGVMSRVTIAITYIRGIISSLITTQEPPSTDPA